MEILIILVLLVLLALPTILMNKRQRAKMAEIQQLQDALQPGDRVVTTAGLHADVVSLSGDLVDLEIAPGVVTTWEKMSVVRVVVDTDAAHADAVMDTDDSLDSADFDQNFLTENDQYSDFHPENRPDSDDPDRSNGHPENR